jgi:hypothetical protein
VSAAIEILLMVLGWRGTGKRPASRSKRTGARPAVGHSYASKD